MRFQYCDILAAVVTHPKCASLALDIFFGLQTEPITFTLKWSDARDFFEDTLPGDEQGVFSTAFGQGDAKKAGIPYMMFLAILASRLEVIQGPSAVRPRGVGVSADMQFKTCGLSVAGELEKVSRVVKRLYPQAESRATLLDSFADDANFNIVSSAFERMAVDVELPNRMPQSHLHELMRHIGNSNSCESESEGDTFDEDNDVVLSARASDSGSYATLVSSAFPRWLVTKVNGWLHAVRAKYPQPMPQIPAVAPSPRPEAVKITAQCAPDVPAPTPRPLPTSLGVVADSPKRLLRKKMPLQAKRVRADSTSKTPLERRVEAILSPAPQLAQIQPILRVASAMPRPRAKQKTSREWQSLPIISTPPLHTAEPKIPLGRTFRPSALSRLSSTRAQL